MIEFASSAGFCQQETNKYLREAPKKLLKLLETYLLVFLEKHRQSALDASRMGFRIDC